jgi:PKD repeat protein
VDEVTRSARRRRLSVGAAKVLATAVAAIALPATPAHAVIEQVKEGAETVEVGAVPRQPAEVNSPAQALQWHGGPVDPATYVYAIYWDPVKAYEGESMRLIDGFLHDVGAASGELENVFALNAQYRSATGERANYDVTFRGAYTDVFPYPANGCSEPKIQPTCLTDQQIRTELKRFVASEHLPTGREVVYYVLTPSAVTVCLDEGGSGNCSTSSKELEEEATDTTGALENTTGFCGYHSVIEPGAESPIVYAVQPWVAGHAGHVLTEQPLTNRSATAAELACQNGVSLVEPNQRSSFTRNSDYEVGLTDLIINQLSLEQSDVMDDPMLSDGWFQSTSNAEQSDMCRGAFGAKTKEEKEEKKKEGTEAENTANQTIDGKRYYLQFGYNSTGISSGHGPTCWNGVELLPHFTATNVVKGGDVVAFDALESSIALDANITQLEPNEPFTAPEYEWQFGDGTSAGPTTEASVFHTYSYAGDYQVTLKVTDSGGYTRTYRATTPVGSPPPPGGPPPGGGSTAGAAGGTTAPTATAPTATTAPTGSGATGPATAPVLSESVLSRSLKRAVSLGLPVRYTVNEQVAGRAEALLDAATAARLRLKGPRATGLPAGYPRQIVVGTAVIVTTRAGQGTVRIKFFKSAAKRLARIHRVKLTLRVVVSNVSPAGVHASSSLSTVVLSH